MSTAGDLEDARQVLIQELAVDKETAERIADLVERRYGREALAHPREAVLRAARWAADRLNALSVQRLERATPPQMLAQLQRDDCPLCASGSDDNGGSSPTHRPVVAPPVYEGVEG